MEQFIFKLEPSSAEQEGGRGPALGPLVPCRTRSTGHWSHPAPSRKAEEWSRGFQQPHKAVLAASSPSHSCPSLAQTTAAHPCPHKPSAVAWRTRIWVVPLEGSTAWMGGGVWGGTCTTGLLSFQPGHHQNSMFWPKKTAPERGAAASIPCLEQGAPSTGRELGREGGKEEEQQPQQKPTLSFHKTAEFISLQPFTSVSSYKMKEALKNRGDEIKPSV